MNTEITIKKTSQEERILFLDEVSKQKKSQKLRLDPLESAPLVASKILEQSENIVLIDATGDLLNKYDEPLTKYVRQNKKVILYTVREEIPFEENENFKMHSLNGKMVEALFESNVRTLIIGDKTRYLVETSQRSFDDRLKKMQHILKEKAAILTELVKNTFDKNYVPDTKEIKEMPEVHHHFYANFDDEKGIQEFFNKIASPIVDLRPKK